VELRRPGGLEIRADAVAEDSRLAHVEDRAPAVLEEVDARPEGEGLEFVLKAHLSILYLDP
jgi:hypothetical protein